MLTWHSHVRENVMEFSEALKAILEEERKKKKKESNVNTHPLFTQKWELASAFSLAF